MRLLTYFFLHILSMKLMMLLFGCCGLVLPVPQREKELKHLSVVSYAVNTELCSVNTEMFAEMCDTYDNRLFNNITRNPHHILHHQYFPLSRSAAAENYNLRTRKHNRMLTQRTIIRVSLILILFIELFILTFY